MWTWESSLCMNPGLLCQSVFEQGRLPPNLHLQIKLAQGEKETQQSQRFAFCSLLRYMKKKPLFACFRVSHAAVGPSEADAGQRKVTCLPASSLGRRYVCRCHVFLSPLYCGASEWRHLLQQRHRGLAEGLNHSHGNAQSWERADKHKHSPYRKAQTWRTTP